MNIEIDMRRAPDVTIANSFVEYSPRPRLHLLVARHYFNAITNALLNPDQCAGHSPGGRGSIYFFPLSDDKYGVARECFRGGLIRLIMKRHYLFLNRPLREFLRHWEIERLGVPAPPLLGVCWQRRGCLYSGSIATERIAGETMTTVLAQSLDSPDICHILSACGQAIRDMHDKGVWHADLQLKNILLKNHTPLFLDFDRARIYHSLPAWRRWDNLFRLRRSLLKQGFRASLFDYILEGYGPLLPNRFLNGWYSLKGKCSDMMRTLRY